MGVLAIATLETAWIAWLWRLIALAAAGRWAIRC